MLIAFSYCNSVNKPLLQENENGQGAIIITGTFASSKHFERNRAAFIHPLIAPRYPGPRNDKRITTNLHLGSIVGFIKIADQPCAQVVEISTARRKMSAVSGWNVALRRKFVPARNQANRAACIPRVPRRSRKGAYERRAACRCEHTRYIRRREIAVYEVDW